MKSVKIALLFFIVILFSAVLSSADEKEGKTHSDREAEAKNSVELKTIKDKISYIVGTQIGDNIRRQGLEPDYDILVQAIKDTVNNKPPRFSNKEMQQIFMEYQDYKTKEKAIKLLGDKAWKVQLKKPERMKFDQNKDYFWILETNKGIIRFKFMPGVAPMHVTSTIFLTEKGFYDGLTFHRVEPNFVIQGGCPLGTGEGGPGYTYDGEYNAFVKHDRPYLLSMANTGSKGTDGSQFFITLSSTPHLDNRHTIFGKVVEGFDVVDKIEDAGSRSGKPKEPLIIVKARIEEKVKS
jgi:peptidyl-prolyl cis-trans isomerase B (cyclophilin B)